MFVWTLWVRHGKGDSIAGNLLHSVVGKSPYSTGFHQLWWPFALRCVHVLMCEIYNWYLRLFMQQWPVSNGLSVGQCETQQMLMELRHCARLGCLRSFPKWRNATRSESQRKLFFSSDSHNYIHLSSFKQLN